MESEFILYPFENEPSCREDILPFKAVKVKEGDVIMGRPTGQGCPITHVMQVIKQDKFGLITVWMVGPQKSRGHRVKDIGHYSVIAFEGIVEGEPKILTRQRFLPRQCMMQAVHSGVVNLIKGHQIRLESILIL